MAKMIISPSGTSRSGWILAWIALVSTLLALNLLAFVRAHAVNVPYWDQWDFLRGVWTGQPWYVLCDLQHGPHRQGFLFCLTAMVLDFTQGDLRVEALWIGSWLVLATILALALVRRMTGRWHPADVLLAMWCLWLMQFETITATPNLSHSIGPLAVLLAAAHCLWTQRPWVRWLGAAMCSWLLTFSGFGLFGAMMLGGLAGVAAVRSLLAGSGEKGYGPALTAFGLIVLGFVVFFRGYVFNPASEGFAFPHYPLRDYAPFLAWMLALPFGFTKATMPAALVGTAGLVLALATMLWQGRKLVCADTDGRRESISLLLVGTSLLFACNTAIGRVHLGTSMGITSRYLSLLLPLPIAAYLLCRTSEWAAGRKVFIAMLGLFALLPYRDFFAEGVPQIGTWGLPREWQALSFTHRDQKLAWYFAYLRTRDVGQANALAHTSVYPEELAARLQSAVKILEDHRVSFAAGDDVSQVLPFAGMPDPVFLGFHPLDSNAHWMTAEGEVLLFPTTPGWLNVEIVNGSARLGDHAALEFAVAGHHGSIAAAEDRSGISLPVEGSQPLALRMHSSAGTRPLSTAGASNAPRDVSFRIGRVRIDPQPRYPTWTAGADGQWRRTRAITRLTGFHGWEEKFGWMAGTMTIEVEMAERSWLNLRIDGRYAGLPAGGRLFVQNGDSKRELVLRDNQTAFSIEFPKPGHYVVSLLSEAGARSPKAHDGADDARELSFRIGQIDLGATALHAPLLSNPR